jgi:hypothetical protein
MVDRKRIQCKSALICIGSIIIILEVRELSDASVVVYNFYNPFQLNDPRYVIGHVLLSQMVNPQIESLVQVLTKKRAILFLLMPLQHLGKIELNTFSYHRRAESISRNWILGLILRDIACRVRNS